MKRLLSVDILRGLAALSVLLYHAYDAGIFVHPVTTMPLLKTVLLWPVSFGLSGVYLFFVISGFCIHLKWAKARVDGDANYRVEFVPFWKRRIRRLYPAYLAALALSLVLFWWQSGIKLTLAFVWDVISHLLLIHNFTPATVYSFNGVFWTLAIEEQLYLAYFLLLFLRVRYGWKVALSICAAVRVFWFALGFVLNRKFNFDLVVVESAAANWFIWALGALSVEACVGLIVLPKWCRSLAVGCVLLVVTMLLSYIDYIVDKTGLAHNLFLLLSAPLWGASFFVLSNWFIESEAKWKARENKPGLVLCLSSLGAVSYSLYLTHMLVFMLAPDYKMFTLPLCIPIAWAFFLLFEKPFLPSRSASPQTALPHRT